MKNAKKKVVVMAVLAAMVLLSLCGCGKGKKYDFSSLKGANDFLGCDFGCTKETILATEKNSLTKEVELNEKILLNYQDVKVDGNSANVIYTIEDGAFVNGIIYYQCDEKEQDETFNQLTGFCEEMLGDTKVYEDSSSINWKAGDLYFAVIKGNKKTNVIFSVETYAHFEATMK